jgi:phosphonate transport system substrate-binding protein
LDRTNQRLSDRRGGGALRLLGTLAAVCVLATIAGCGEKQSAAPAAGPTTTDEPDRSGWPEKVRFGLVPSEGGADIVERMKPLVDHLSRELGIPVEAFSASEYQGVVTAMQNKQVDIAYFGPQSYVVAHRIAGAQAIAKELSEAGSTGYHAILVVHKDTGWKTLADLKGKKLAFVSPMSTSGYLVPSVALEEQLGMAPEAYFSEIVFTGSHGSSVQRVVNKDVDVAATNDMDLNSMVLAGQVSMDPLVEVWRSDLIPGSPMAVRRDLPESFKLAAQRAFISFSKETEALARMGRVGFVEARDEEYDLVRLMDQKKSAKPPG